MVRGGTYFLKSRWCWGRRIRAGRPAGDLLQLSGRGGDAVRRAGDPGVEARAGEAVDGGGGGDQVGGVVFPAAVCWRSAADSCPHAKLRSGESEDRRVVVRPTVRGFERGQGEVRRAPGEDSHAGGHIRVEGGGACGRYVWAVVLLRGTERAARSHEHGRPNDDAGRRRPAGGAGKSAGYRGMGKVQVEQNGRAAAEQGRASAAMDERTGRRAGF